MSLDIVRQVDRAHPSLLQTNIGPTCHQFTLRVIAALRAEGHQAFLMCKTPGEGQYVPPGFQPRQVKGLNGQTYTCSGVSHDAIWVDGAQYDTIASANDEDHPIFNANGSQIVGQPVWNGIAPNFWRANNPPLTDDGIQIPVPTPAPPTQPAPAPRYPEYEELGGDEGAKKITRQLEADYKRAGRPGLDGDCGGWLRRVDYDFMTGKEPTVEASIAKHRPKWCAALGIGVQ